MPTDPTAHMSRKEATAYAKALQMIEQCRKSGETRLDLFGFGLSALPPDIGQLTALTKLYLHDNQLSTLPPEIGQLTALTELDLRLNQLSTLPPEIGQLTALRVLGLNGNRLRVLPPEISQLAALTALYLGGSQLSTLPAEIGQLTALTTLSLYKNQLSTLPPEIGQLTALTALSLSDNQLSTLPPEIGKLTKLEALYLDGNALTALPPAMAQLKNLKQLYLHCNDALGLPTEVLGATWQERNEGKGTRANPQDILAYYFAADWPLREVRVIVVGDAKVGKTSLVRRLEKKELRLNESETHSIDIRPLTLKGKGGAWQARFWDFGGQHVLYAMHEFFLSKRCVYLVVLEQRENNTDKEARYWLQTIRAFAGMDAPIIVALNKSGGIKRDLAEQALEAEYGKVVAWLPTDCETKYQYTIDALREKIIETLDARPVEKFPHKWLGVKHWLEKLPRPYVSYDDFVARCGTEEPDAGKQAQLAELMHDLGIAMNYSKDSRLRNTSVLRPNWLANGIHAILRANMLCKVPLAADGVISLEKLPAIYQAAHEAGMLQQSEYKDADARRFILQLMELFSLSFPLDTKDHEYLVPTLLKADPKVQAMEPMGAQRVRVKWHFPVVPAPLMGRLMVALFPYLDRNALWQMGAMLQYGLEANAKLWRPAGTDNMLCLTVAPTPLDPDNKSRDELLGIIRLAVWQEINKYGHLEVKEEWEAKVGGVQEFVSRAVLVELGKVPPDPPGLGPLRATNPDRAPEEWHAQAGEEEAP